jgi:hypothetical protein
MTKLGEKAPVERFTDLFSSCEYSHLQKAFLEKCKESQVLAIANECKLASLDIATLIMTKLGEKAPVERFTDLFSSCEYSHLQEAFLEKCTESQKAIFQN